MHRNRLGGFNCVASAFAPRGFSNPRGDNPSRRPCPGYPRFALSQAALLGKQGGGLARGFRENAGDQHRNGNEKASPKKHGYADGVAPRVQLKIADCCVVEGRVSAGA